MNKRTTPADAADDNLSRPLPATLLADHAGNAPTAPTDWPPDQYTGIGGTYLRDPITGVRTPVQPEAPAPGDTAAA